MIIRIKIETEDALGKKPVSEVVISSVTRGKKPVIDYKVRLLDASGVEVPEADILGHREEMGIYFLIRKALSVLGPQIESINRKKENEESNG
jgi:hypothetical protein